MEFPEILEIPNFQVAFPKTGTLRNITYKDGTIYSGEWMNGKRNGQGIQKYSNDSDRNLYQGSWNNDVEEGKGHLLYKSGDIYKGDMVQGLRHGEGLLTFGKANDYERLSFDGNWKEDTISGNGTMKWRAGDYYIGEFENGLRQGQGVLTYSEENVNNLGVVRYEGEWKDGSISGFGTMIYVEKGKKYTGQWFNYF